jgi:NADH:ubiquinone oxidoreductase subunit 4 (subunit M)
LVYGRSPLFFDVLHLYFFALIGLVFASRGGSGLAVMYPIWLAVLIPLYFLCRWYGDFKRIKPAGSIWKFF